MKKPKLLIDMDGVIVNLIDPWLSRINQDQGTNYTKNDIKGGIMESTGIPEEVCCTYFYEKDFWLSLPPQDDVMEYLPKLDELFDIIIVTKAHFASPYCSHEKYMWMIKHFGKPFKMVQTKYKSYVRGAIIIDDMGDNLKRCHERGKTTICYAQPWNVDVDFGYKANSWKEIYQILLDHLENIKEQRFREMYLETYTLSGC